MIWTLRSPPGLPLYTRNFLDVTAVGKFSYAYRRSDGTAMERQVFPDTPEPSHADLSGWTKPRSFTI
jgi:hypothetical protein